MHKSQTLLQPFWTRPRCTLMAASIAISRFHSASRSSLYLNSSRRSSSCRILSSPSVLSSSFVPKFAQSLCLPSRPKLCLILKPVKPVSIKFDPKTVLVSVVLAFYVIGMAFSKSLEIYSTVKTIAEASDSYDNLKKRYPDFRKKGLSVPDSVIKSISDPGMEPSELLAPLILEIQELNMHLRFKDCHICKCKKNDVETCAGNDQKGMNNVVDTCNQIEDS